MNPQIQRRTLVFIVRLWGEYLNEHPPCWRGVVEGCEPGEKAAFTNMDELNDIIRQKALSKMGNER